MNYKIAPIVLFSLVLFASCKKNDKIHPVISLNGNYEENVSLGDTYNDPGATATDNKEGDISDRIVVTGSVNTNQVGDYKLFYNVDDEVGNKAPTATRYVNVINDANHMVGTYTATPVCSGTWTSFQPYNTTVVADDKNNNQIWIKQVLYLVQDDPILGEISGSTITVPLQTIGQHTVEGTASLAGSDFYLSITIDDGATYQCSIDYVKL